MKTLFCAIALALAVGCTTAKVRPYVGQQQAWPTAIGGIVNTSYELPVFTSLPPSPYAVLAELRIDSPFYAQPEEHHLPVLVKKATTIGADAIVLVDGQIYFSTSYGPRDAAPTKDGGTPTVTTVNRFNPDFFKPGVTAIAIKWTGNPPAGLFRNAVTTAATEALAPTATPAPEATPATTTNEPPVVAPAPATPAPTTEPKPEPPAPAVEPPKTETPPATPAAVPEPPKTETAPPPAAATPEPPKTETTPPPAAATPAPAPTPETPATPETSPATMPEPPKSETVPPPTTEQPQPAPTPAAP